MPMGDWGYVRRFKPRSLDGQEGQQDEGLPPQPVGLDAENQEPVGDSSDEEQDDDLHLYTPNLKPVPSEIPWQPSGRGNLSIMNLVKLLGGDYRDADQVRAQNAAEENKATWAYKVAKLKEEKRQHDLLAKDIRKNELRPPAPKWEWFTDAQGNPVQRNTAAADFNPEGLRPYNAHANGDANTFDQAILAAHSKGDKAEEARLVDLRHRLYPDRPANTIVTTPEGLGVVNRNNPTGVTNIPGSEGARTGGAGSVSEARLKRLAADLASGKKLTRIRDITSMRGDQRAALYDEILAINPKYDTQEIERKVKAVDYFQNGKGAESLQSFGTFLQHAGEIIPVMDHVALGKNPALNKPLNWWRKNMAGSPELAAFETSLEPVGKEFESFLLSNRALYESDRKNVQEMLSGNMSPLQINASIKQMVKTAKDRYVEMNQRYKRVVGEDLDPSDVFSDSALAAAEKYGVPIKGSNPIGGAEPKAGGQAGPPQGGQPAGGQKLKPHTQYKINGVLNVTDGDGVPHPVGQ